MALWVIRIVAADHPEDPPQFVPQLQPGGPQGLLAQAGDSVSWTNDTLEAQQPWPADASFNPLPANQVRPRRQPSSNYLSDEIPPGHSSRPNWIVVRDRRNRGQLLLSAQSARPGCDHDHLLNSGGCGP